MLNIPERAYKTHVPAKPASLLPLHAARRFQRDIEHNDNV